MHIMQHLIKRYKNVGKFKKNFKTFYKRDKNRKVKKNFCYIYVTLKKTRRAKRPPPRRIFWNLVETSLSKDISVVKKFM